MKLLTGGKDISELIEQIKWAGDTRQVARTVQFTIAKNKKDKDFPAIVIEEGAEIIMQDDNGKAIFGGIIFDIDKSAGSKVETYLAYDLMFYINNSDVNQLFDGTPETIVRGICTELGIECGKLAATGVQISMPCFGKKAYEAIMMAYTAAARQNGSKYIPLMTDINKVSVLEKGSLCGVVMNGDYNLVGATYKSTLQKLVNRVLITDKNNNLIKTVEDAASIQKYGLVQRVLKQDDDEEDAADKAQNMLATIEATATVSGVPNDFRAISGYSIIVQETDTGLYGKFYIESDTHTFSCGKAQMDLTLAFENLMDEKDIEETS